MEPTIAEFLIVNDSASLKARQHSALERTQVN